MLRVFVSYAKEDRALVAPYYAQLNEAGFGPWMDVESLLPGQNWEAEIEKAFNDAHVVLLFLSPRSVSKRGFVQREANAAVENLRYKLPTDIYAIPLLLEKCDVPAHISRRLQYEDLQTPGAWDRVIGALRLAAIQQQVSDAEGVEHGPFQVFTEEIRDVWRGRPGHDISITYPRFQSSSHPAAANELSALFRGRAARVHVEARQKPWDQSPDLFKEVSRDQPGFPSSNGRWDSFVVSHANGNVVSLLYTVGWYGAGAAHPNSHFETHNFALIDGRVFLIELEDVFSNLSEGIERISAICTRDLRRQYWEKLDEEPDADAVKWIEEGAGPSADNFRAFTISADHLTLLFAPYEVASYSLQSWSVDVSFFDLLDVLRAPGVHTAARG